MSKKENNKDLELEQDSEVENLEKLGVMFDTLEQKALEYRKKEKNAEKDIFIEKANLQKSQEKILKTQETEILEVSENLDDITAEMVGALFIPIDLFINEGLENKGITPITEAEIQKLFNLLLKTFPKEVFEKFVEISKKTKKLDWLKNLDKGIAIFRHLFKMTHKRFKQYKAWKKLQEKE